jgi:phosphohistidine phosphatase
MTNTTRLVLMRHAKSDWFSGDDDDFSRPLSDRGLRDARQMARWLNDGGYLASAIWCSPARRTRQTLELVADTAGVDLGARTEWTDELYHASAATLRSLLRRAGRGPSLLVLGHNPGLEELLAFLVDDQHSFGGFTKRFPTAAVYALDVLGEFSEMKAGCARIIAHQRPKMLGA